MHPATSLFAFLHRRPLQLLAVMSSVVLVLGLVAFLVPQRVRADNTGYYIDCSAGGNGNGSAGSPWNTLASINATTFGPGDQILFRAGTTCTGQLHPLGSGNGGATITISSYGTGNKPRIAGGGGAATVVLQDQQYWDITNLDITNDAANNDANRAGIRVVNSTNGQLNHIHLTNLFIHNVKGYVAGYYGDNGGIAVVANGNNTASVWNDVVIQDNTITTVDRVGIFVGPDNNLSTGGSATNVVIQRNTITDSGGDGILTYVVTAPLVQRNVVGNSGTRVGGSCPSAGYCNQNAAAIWCNKVDQGIFQYNEVFNNAGNNDGEAYDFDDDTTNTVFQYNYSHDNPQGAFVWFGYGNSYNDIARYNISQNDGKTFYWQGSNATNNVQIYNNTIYTSSGTITQLTGTTPTNVTFTNNIIVNQGNGSYAGIGAWDHNLFFGNHPGSEPSDSNALTGDPLFVNPNSGATGLASVDGYKLQTASPALGSGAVVGNNGGQDYFGNGVASNSAPNRGAYAGGGVGGNFGFESGTLDPWYVSNGSPAVVSGNAHSGSESLNIGTAYSGANQTLTNLLPNTTYVLSGWILNSAAGDAAYIGVKDFGGNETSTAIAGTSYTQGHVTFTTGANTTSATMYCYKNAGVAPSYCDDITLALQQNLARDAGLEWGTLSPWYESGSGNAAVVGGTFVHSGNLALQTGAAYSGLNQDINGLQPNTTYQLQGWGANADGGDAVYIGVKGFGGNETSTALSGTAFTQGTVTFTTGSNNTSATIYCYKNGGVAPSYCDDFSVVRQ